MNSLSSAYLTLSAESLFPEKGTHYEKLSMAIISLAQQDNLPQKDKFLKSAPIKMVKPQ
jgi:hypothetical protein